MLMKIAVMMVLMSTIFIFDIIYFFPAAIAILLILNSIEKDLRKDHQSQ